MNVSAFTRGYPVFTRRAGAASGSSAFADKLSAPQQPTHTFIQGPPIHLRMGENILCGGDVRGQTYTAEYTAGSTDEDPVVRISGRSSGGEFDFTRHIRDIDPANASYAELAALHAYLRRTGAYQSGETGALPTGMECGDIARKRNYLKELERFIEPSSKSGVYPKLGPKIYSHARELLKVYQDAAQSRELSRANVSGKAAPFAFRSGGASRESAFSKYLDVNAQRRKMRELPPNQGLPSVYLQFMHDYEDWKSRQPEMDLPDSQGWSDENLAFLRNQYGEGELSANEIYDALSAMQDMGMLSEKGKNCAAGVTWVRVNLSESGVYETNVDPDSRAAWLHGFDEAPMVGFHSLEDIISWAKEYRDEDYPDFVSYGKHLWV